jgi:hypothetical protein
MSSLYPVLGFLSILPPNGLVFNNYFGISSAMSCACPNQHNPSVQLIIILNVYSCTCPNQHNPSVQIIVILNVYSSLTC